MGKQTLVGSNFVGFKNRIINGDFSIWQRGTSFTLGGNTGAYTADRIHTSNNTDGEFVVEKSTISFMNSFKITTNTSPSDLTGTKYWYGLNYLFEGQHLYDLAMNKKTITISFWFKSNVNGKYSVSMRNFTDYTTNIQSYVTTFDYVGSEEPQKITITIPLDADWNPALVNNENVGFTLSIGFLNQGNYVTSTTEQWVNGNYLTAPECVNWGATAGNYIEIAELQVEEGDVATDFEYIPYDVQLQRCYRYCFKSGSKIYPDVVGVDNKLLTYQFPTVMRTQPSVSIVYRDQDGKPKDVNYISDACVRFSWDKDSSAGFIFLADAEL